MHADHTGKKPIGARNNSHLLQVYQHDEIGRNKLAE